MQWSYAVDWVNGVSDGVVWRSEVMEWNDKTE